MTILAIEFSSERRSVAVAAAGKLLGKAEETGGRTARAFALVESALTNARLNREQVECIAVGLGPGSYAGIRAAIALAQGWQIANGIRILGLTSVECLAWQAQSEELFGRVAVLIDAQRNEFYCAVYEIDSSQRRLVESLQLVSHEEALARSKTGTVIVAPDLLTLFPTGRALFPDAPGLAMLAAEHDGFVSGEKLEPVYLREASFVKAAPPRQIHRPS